MQLGQGEISIGTGYASQSAAQRKCPPGYRAYGMRRAGPGAVDPRQTEYRCIPPAPRPVAAPAPAAAPITITPTFQVSPAIQTAVSPQISPVMAQMQASPGAAIRGAPAMVTEAPQIAKPTLAPRDIAGERARANLQRELDRMKMEKQMREEFEAQRKKEEAERARMPYPTFPIPAGAVAPPTVFEVKAEDIGTPPFVPEARPAPLPVPEQVSVPSAPDTAPSFPMARDMFPEAMEPPEAPRREMPVTEAGMGMMLPILLLGGGAVLLLTQKKGKRK